jgi:hypothetical protein
MKIISTFVAWAIVPLIIAPVHAHHSFSAVYDVGDTIEVEGKIVQFLFRNPHSVLHVLAPNESGEMTRWAVEWQGATQLGAGGISAQFLRPGDPVIVTGNPGRNPAEHRIRMLTIERTTDGFGWGTRPGEVVD